MTIATLLAIALAARTPTSTPEPTATPTPSAFDLLYRAAESLERAPEADEYLPKALAVVGPALANSMQACTDRSSVGLSFRMVVKVTGTGKVTGVLFQPPSPVTACVAKHFNVKSVPPPPRSEWPLAFHMTVK
jgi:hypothetical protein